MNSFKALVQYHYPVNQEAINCLEDNYSKIPYSDVWWRDYLQTIPNDQLTRCPRLRHFIEIRRRVLEAQEETKRVLEIYSNITSDILKYCLPLYI
jgi:hypothetical protein